MEGESELVASEEDVEALRVLILFARNKSGMGLSRRELCIAANVRGTDIDNFTSKNRSTDQYKTHRPHNRILSRLLKFASTDKQLRSLIEGQRSDLGDALRRVTISYQSLEKYSADDDHFFLYLNRIHAMDEQKCLSVCNNLSGNYYGYRFSTTKKKIVRSHFEIEKFDPTRKIPNFVHHLRYQDGPIRLTRGQILDFGTSYAFIGFVCVGTYDYDGVKFMVINKGKFGFSGKLNGLFISFAGDATYQMGTIQLIKTEEKYNADMIGEYSIEDVVKHDTSFNANALRRDASLLLDEGFLVGALS